MKSYMRFFKIFVLLICLCKFSNVVHAQWYNPDLPIIEEFSINPKTINKEVGDMGDHPKLWEENGYVYIPNTYYKQKRTGSLGMLVVHTFDGRYVAYERRCAKCFYIDGISTSRIKMVAPYSIRAHCPVCGVWMDGIIMHGSGALSCCSDDIEEPWPHQIDSYITEKYKVNGQTMIKITTNPCAYPN